MSSLRKKRSKPWEVEWRDGTSRRTRSFDTKASATEFASQLARGSKSKIRKRETDRWEVRWADSAGHRSRTFTTAAGAEAFLQEVRSRERQGDRDAVAEARRPFGEFVAEWWVTYAARDLSKNTREVYLSMWERHAHPVLGDKPIDEITPKVIAQLRNALHNRGVGAQSIIKTMTMLQSVFRAAVEHGIVDINPVAQVKKPKAGRKRSIRPLAPESVERMRRWLLDDDRQSDALLVAVLAYAGLRPGEALGLRWFNVGAKSLSVERAIALGEERPTKTGSNRVVRLLGPLREDFARARLSLCPSEDAWVFARSDGEPWSGNDWRLWRRRRFDGACRAAGVSDARPYDLRHSFVSLLVHEGRSIVEVASQAGHSPQTCLGNYAHLFAEFDNETRVSAEAAIVEAREKVGGERQVPLFRSI